MTARRKTYNSTDNPSGFSGQQLADDVNDQVAWMSAAVINPVGSIGGTGNAITGTVAPAVTSYVDRQQFEFVPTAANTGAVTVSWGGGVVALKAPDGTALVANDLQIGVPVRHYYDSTAGYMRMAQWSQRAQSAAAVASFSTQWALIGDTTVSVATASVEHTFTAGSYAKIMQVLSGLASASDSVNIVATLRNASGAIVTLTTTGFNGGNANMISTHGVAAQVDYLIDTITSGSDRTHYGLLRGGGYDSLTFHRTLNQIEAVGNNSTAPDRVRIAYTSGNVGAGRIVTLGMKI